jgi:hypothetical protein
MLAEGLPASLVISKELLATRLGPSLGLVLRATEALGTRSRSAGTRLGVRGGLAYASPSGTPEAHSRSTGTCSGYARTPLERQSRQHEQINCLSCRRAEVSGSAQPFRRLWSLSLRRRVLPPQDRRIEHEAGRKGELGFFRMASESARIESQFPIVPMCMLCLAL